MPVTPEDKARQAIDRLLEQAGWKIQDRRNANLSLPGGVAVREFSMPSKRRRRGQKLAQRASAGKR